MNAREQIIERMARVAHAAGDNLPPLELARICGGYYECPKDASGKRLGPVVGYAGKDDLGRQYVGDTYINFAMAERYGSALGHVGQKLSHQLSALGISPDGYCGAPEGGKALATLLSSLNHSQYIFPEKKVTAAATANSREKSELVFSRHEPAKGERFVIVEDVCNNFSTTKTLVELIEAYGAQCVAVVCFLNRSTEFEDEFVFSSPLNLFSTKLPVVSMVRKSIPQYRQDDPEVARDIEVGNVVWKPKNEWDRLALALVG